MPPPRHPLLATAWRTLVGAAAAYWLGGTLFYITIVIHTAHRVLGSQREVGFVTREVTRQLNLIGWAVLALLLVNLVFEIRRPALNRPAAARLLLATWLALAALHAGLCVLHPRIDRLLDPAAERILDRRAFKGLHNTYMAVTTLQLAAGVVHLATALRAPAQAGSPPMA